MSDVISRQEAIDYFVTNVGFHDEDGYPIEDEEELREIWTGYFDGIPSAQPEQHYDEWCDSCKEYDKEKHSCPRWNKVIKSTVEELKSAQPEQRWISVTERLPVEEGRYLVCGKKGGIYHANYRGRWWTQVGCGGKFVPSVVAWMPMPKPWGGDAK